MAICLSFRKLLQALRHDKLSYSTPQSDLKKVLVWRNTWLPGSQTFIRNQVESYQNWESVTLGLRLESSPLSRPSDQIVGHPRARYPRLALVRVSQRDRILSAIRDARPNLIHAHFAFDARLVRRAARRLGVPLIVTVHGNDVTAGPRRRGLRGWAARIRIRRTLKNADIVIAVSEFIKDAAIRAGAIPARTLVHHIGIPLPLDPPAPAEPPRWDIIFVGRLVEKKGVRDLLRALVLLDAQGITPSVGIVGDGPLREEIVDEAEPFGLRIEFLGSLPPESVHAALQAARLFVAPSRTAASGDSEGFGMVFLEAAAHGLPTVAYRHGGVSEAVMDGVTGLLSPEGDFADLASNIRTLLSDEGRRSAMGNAAKKRVYEKFDVRTQTLALEEIYNSVALSDL